MTQEDDSQERVQAMRSVEVHRAPNSVPPVTPDEIYHIDIQLDPETQKEVVLWEDIQQAFRNAVQVRNKTRVVPFLKGKDLRTLEPRRIAAVPNTVLDVAVDNPLMEKGFTSPQVQQLALQLVPPQNDDSGIKVEVASQEAVSTPVATPSPSITPTPTPPSTATSTVTRNPVYGLVETAMENYSHIDRPLDFSSARGPQAVQDEQTYIVKDPPASSHPNSGNEGQLRRPQIATTNLLVGMDVVQMSISAYQGDKDAQVALGDMYRDGNGVAQDYQTAMDWYLKAVEQGDAAGQQRVGGLYDKGFGVLQNHSTAMDWYLRSSEQGYALAQHSIGVLYYYGRGVIRDHVQAMDWYHKAADQGHAPSQYSIGCLHYNGEGVTLDYAKAMEWFLKAANQGHASAQSDIGLLYRHGRGGVEQNRTKAIEWYQKAADQGNAFAKRVLKDLSEEQAVV